MHVACDQMLSTISEALTNWLRTRQEVFNWIAWLSTSVRLLRVFLKPQAGVPNSRSRFPGSSVRKLKDQRKALGSAEASQIRLQQTHQVYSALQQGLAQLTHSTLAASPAEKTEVLREKEIVLQKKWPGHP